MNATIMLISESGNIAEVISRFKEVVSDMKITEFKFAVIRQNRFDFFDENGNEKKKRFYPLKLYASNGIKIKVSEVRCGKNDERANALIEILTLAGLAPKEDALNAIYNKINANIIIWNEKLIKQF